MSDELSEEADALSAEDHRLFDALERYGTNRVRQRYGTNRVRQFLQRLLEMAEEDPNPNVVWTAEDPFPPFPNVVWTYNNTAITIQDDCISNMEGNNDTDTPAAAVQQALRDGANVNAVRNDATPLMNDATPLMKACGRGFEEIVGILLDADADARWKDRNGWSAITSTCSNGHLSTVQLLLNHDSGLLEIVDNYGWTPLFHAIQQQHSDIVRFLLDSGADPHHVDQSGATALMYACRRASLEIARLLLAGADVGARDVKQQTALHHAVSGRRIEVLCELILQHNANMFAVDNNGRTPFDLADILRMDDADIDRLLEIYGNKLTQNHGNIALHELLKVADYSFAEDHGFHPPLNPLQIILPLGKLTLKHLRTLLHNLDHLDPALIRNLDDTGKLPIHIACQTNAPVEVLALILELDLTTLHIADSAGALPIHLLLCGSTTSATEYASVRCLVEHGGVGTLAARNPEGLLPLHVLSGSANPPLPAVQYLMQSYPGSVAMRTNAGDYPFMMAAARDSSLASLSVVYELVRANPDSLVPKSTIQRLD